MEKPVVVGLLGRRGSGKSTAATHIGEVYGARRSSFAAPLKAMAKLLFDLSDEQVYGTQEQKEVIDPRYGVSPRTLMIRLGDGGRNTLGKKIWIDACFNKIMEEFVSGELQWAGTAVEGVFYPPIFVIDDVRYPNEAYAITHDERFHGFVVKLVCPDLSTSDAYTQAPSEMSVDEVPQENIDFAIVSRKTPGSVDLRTRVDGVVQEMLSRISPLESVKTGT